MRVGAVVRHAVVSVTACFNGIRHRERAVRVSVAPTNGLDVEDAAQLADADLLELQITALFPELL